ncbi:hypothetical protein JCM8202v2_000457 [Rhodotorula sphaerocarpa]
MATSLSRAPAPARRTWSSSPRSATSEPSTSATPEGVPRSYFYDVDVHGQLFLSTAKHRNVATAYRDPRFLDTFFARLRRNATLETEEAKDARAGGFEFVSECMGEINYVRPDRDGTALVFQALEGQDLRYGGTLTRPFDPASLRVDASTGYLFHPSPVGRRTKRSRVGPFSLLRSSLVLENFADSLELDDHGGGSLEFDGQRHRIEPLQPGDIWRRQDMGKGVVTQKSKVYD